MEQYFRNRASVDDDPDLARNRRANDARLKSRFEHIFTKYGRDFEGVGDEIDLETGEIIVNNGHVQRMRHEVDPGKGVSSQVLQVLGSGLGNGRGEATEDSWGDWEDDEESSVSGYSSSENANDYVDGQTHQAHDELSSDFYPPEYDDQVTAEESAQESRGRTPSGIGNLGDMTTARETSRNASPGNHLAYPSSFQDTFRESLETMRVKPGRQRASMGPDAIEALGRSIADQLARFMNGNSRAPRKKSRSQKNAKDSRWQYPMLPGDRSGRTPSPPPPASPSAALFMASPDREASIWAPQQARRQRKRQKSRLNNEVSAAGFLGDLSTHSATNADDSDGEDTRKLTPTCYNCGASDAYSWRQGPGGLLCNPCGSYYHKYGLQKRIEDRKSLPKAGPELRSSTMPAARRSHQTVEEADVYDVPVTSTPAAMTEYTANTARRMTGDARQTSVTIEEEEKIIKLREVDKMTWEEIASSLSNRPAHLIQSHYTELLSRPSCEARQRLLDRVVPGVQSNDTNQGTATPSRDQAQGSTEADVPEEVMEPVVYDGDSDHSDEIKRRGLRRTYSKSEDQQIIHLREVEGLTWKEIGGFFPGRTLLALKTHYSIHLKDRNPLTHSGYSRKPYTPEEDERLIKMRDGENKDFTEIAVHIPGRSAGGLAQHYTALKARGPPRLPIQPLARRESIDPALEYNDETSSNSVSEYDDARTRMPPPPNPAERDKTTIGTPARLAQSNASGRTHRHEQHNGPLPQTPLVSNPLSGYPPHPPEVGPSAWITTQPTSKGPLPFQPARKRLHPVQHGSLPFEVADPFFSRSASAAASRRRNSTLGASSRRLPRLGSQAYENQGAVDQSSEPARKSTRKPSTESSRQAPLRPENSIPSASEGSLAPVNVDEGIALAQDQVQGYAEDGGTYHLAVPLSHGCAAVERANAVESSMGGALIRNASTEEEQELSTDQDSSENQIVPFTSEQDGFIRLCREKHKMSWTDIAENMPGNSVHTVQAVTDRYYDVIMTKPVRTKAQKSAKGSVLDWKRGQRYTEEESMKVVQLRNEGLGWTKMAQFMPGRSPKSLQNYHYQYSTRQQPSPQPKQLADSRKHDTPLLRQALNNSTRRPSHGSETSKSLKGNVNQPHPCSSATSGLDSSLTQRPQREDRQASKITSHEAERDGASSCRGALQDDAIDVVEDNFLQGMRSYLSAPTAVAEDENHGNVSSGMPNAAQHQSQLSPPVPQHMSQTDIELHDGRDSSIAPATRSNSSELGVSAHPEPEFYGDDLDYEHRTSSRSYSTLYDTPAKANLQSMPYFLATNHNWPERRMSTGGLRDCGDPVPPPDEEDVTYEMQHDEPSATQMTLPEAAPSDSTIVNNRLLATKLHTTTKPGRAAVDSSAGTKRKRSSVLSKRVSDFEVADSDSDSPYVDDGHEDLERVMHSTRSKRNVAPPKRYGPKASPHQVAEATEPEADGKSQASGARPRAKRHKHSDASAAEEATGQERNEDLPENHGISHIPTSVNGAAPSQNNSRAQHATLKPAAEKQDGTLARPNMDWIEVVATAIRSSSDQCMTGKDVLRWVRDNYPYYRTSQEPWPFRVHNALRRNPLFVRIDPDDRKAGYTLADKEKEIRSAKPVRESTYGQDTNEGAEGIVNEKQESPPAFPARDSPAGANDNDSETTQQHTMTKSPTRALPATQPAHSAAKAPEIIAISSDPSMEPDSGSDGRNIMMRSSRRPGAAQQPTPRAKGLRKSDTALIRRGPSLVTPARSSAHISSLNARSAISTKSELLSRTTGRGTPVTQTGLGERRVLFARDVKPGEEDEEMDELS